MSKKVGNGGHGLENYDPETGRYIETGEGDTQYHSGTHFSVAQISEMLSNGYYGQDIANLYNNGDEEEKSALIGYLQVKLDDFYTKQKLENQKDYKPLTIDEFREYGAICAANTTQEDKNFFYSGYRGAGQRAFEFNKALRTGNLEVLNRVGISVERFEAQVAAFDRLANSFKAPKDMLGVRFDQTGPIFSWFGKSGVLNGLPTKEAFGYTQLDQENLDLKDLADRLSRLIGSVVPKDGAYSSFSCVEKQSHMTKNPDKIICTKYNIPKGKNCFISQYEYESEGFFPRDTKFIMQDVKVENIDGVERVVLYYGVE